MIYIHLELDIDLLLLRVGIESTTSGSNYKRDNHYTTEVVIINYM